MHLVEIAQLGKDDLPPGDYVSPGLDVVRPDAAFPHLTIGETDDNPWPFLRREIAQNWYVDDRDPTVGFCSRDEAAILYNTARLFAGRPCIEIGCWRGWSSCHLALGAGSVHVVDPILQDNEFLEDVRGSLSRAGVLDLVDLHTGSSPEAVESLSTDLGLNWSLAFIDGDHEGDAPRNDAVVIARHAAADAQVLFHDLASPDVARGLAEFRELGWHTMVFQTMQIMGVAWRGATSPVYHEPDPNQTWTLPEHLASFQVCGENTDDRAKRFLAVLDSSAEQVADSRSVQASFDELSQHNQELSDQFAALHAAYVKTVRRLGESQTRLSQVQIELHDLRDLAAQSLATAPPMLQSGGRATTERANAIASRMARAVHGRAVFAELVTSAARRLQRG